jgi:Squalene-hopene cyclase C-terminal domain
MNKFLWSLAICSVTPLALAADATIADSASLKTAVQKGLGLLVKTSPHFIKRGGCNSCHNQFLPAMAQVVARDHGIDPGPDIAQMSEILGEFTGERLNELISIGGSGQMGFVLLDAEARKKPADLMTDACVRYLQSMQQADGRWRTVGNRPPITFDDTTTTVLAIRGLQVYAPESQREDVDRRIARARAWLVEAKPSSNQERAYRLIGLALTKAGRRVINSAVQDLLATQRQDGGWSQLSSMETDAYATGQALYALGTAGSVAATDAAYQRGVQYLLKTQAGDGSWHVKSRSLPIQPYFESGFPYGHDQWISSAGTCWAAMALSLAVEPKDDKLAINKVRAGRP